MKLNSLYIALAILTLMGCAEKEKFVVENFLDFLKTIHKNGELEYSIVGLGKTTLCRNHWEVDRLLKILQYSPNDII